MVFCDRTTSADDDLSVWTAIELYEEGKQLPMLSTDDYIEHIRDVPQYYHLTTKDLANMRCDLKLRDLVNGHLSKR